MTADSYQTEGTYYKDMPIQPWEMMESLLTPEEFIGFLKGSIIGYQMRAGKKPGAELDIQKAKHYIQKLEEIKIKYAKIPNGLHRPGF